MKLNITLIIFYILISSFSYPQNISLEIFLDKKEYLLREPIFALVTLFNNSDQIIALPFFTAQIQNDEVQIDFKDENGKDIDRVIDEKQINMELNSVRLLPGESVCDFFPISRLYGVKGNEINGGAFGLEKYFMPLGKYFIKIKLTLKHINLVLESNQIEISVINPKKSDDKKCYALLKESANRFREQNLNKFKEGLNLIIEDSLESSYKLIAYGKLILTEHRLNNDRYKELIKTMILKYPDNLYTYIITSFFWLKEKEIFNEEFTKNRIINSKYFNSLSYFFKGANLFTD